MANEVAKMKIYIIQEALHKLARKTCPKYMDASPCQSCDVECPFDQLSDTLEKIKKQ